MKSRSALAGILALLFWFGICDEGASRTAEQKSVDFAKIERLLKTAPVVSIDKMGSAGRNAPWVVVLEEGKTGRRAIFKYIDRPKPAALRSSYKLEVAAYELDKLLGFQRVPPAVLRQIEDKRGSLQIMAEDCIPEMERKRKGLDPPDKKAFELALEDIGVFEALTACEGDDLSDILIDVNDWWIYRVDFSEAFSTATDLPPDWKIRGCSRALYQSLLKLADGKVRTKLDPYLSEEEIAALLARKKIILGVIEKLIKEKGETAELL